MTPNIDFQNFFTDSIIDKTCLDLIAENSNKLVPWYILIKYARDVENDETFVSRDVAETVRSRLIRHWYSIEHDLKSDLKLEDVEQDKCEVDYTKDVVAAYHRLKEIH